MKINTVKLGIDPGLTGAIALLNGDELIKLWDMPLTERRSGKGQEVNPYLLSDIIAEVREISANHALTAQIEEVGAMPGQGVTAMFGFGMSFGIVRGVLAAHGISTTAVRPQAWKKRFSLIRKDKDASRALAIERFPEHSRELSRKKDNGRADAIFIALYN